MNKKEQILSRLNEQQKAAVIDYQGACAILACPGAGKTASLIARAAYMIEDGIPAENILLFTFTKKASNEIKDRVISKIGEAGKEITVGTYHSFCVKLLRKYSDYIGFARNFSIYDETDKMTILKEITQMKQAELKTVVNYISRWKMNLISPETAMSIAKNKTEESYADIYKKYSQKMRSCNSFDFDDLIFYAIKILEENKNVRDRVQDKYKYITCDEAHDSSPEDLRLIELLGGNSMNVCLILDPDQSIYSFRGANMPAVYKFIKKNNFKQFLLECNYRSTSTIVDAAHSMIVNNVHEIEKKPFAYNGKGHLIRHYTVEDTNKEATKIVQIIKGMHNKGYHYSDMAVLYRTGYLSRKVEEALIKNRISYEITGGVPFYERREIKDIVSYLRFLVNPYDYAAFKRIVNIPKRGIGDKAIENLLLNIEKKDIINERIDLFEICEKAELKGKAKTGINDFINAINTLANVLYGATPKEYVEKTISIINYDAYLKSVFKDETDIEDRKANLKELINIASTFTEIEEFIYSLTLNVDIENDEEDGKVSLMTMHASKGLEFSVVIITDAVEGVVPHQKSLDYIGDIEEERRLFYVAMTRAEELLFMLTPERMMFNGRYNYVDESRFVGEISSQYLQKQ